MRPSWPACALVCIAGACAEKPGPRPIDGGPGTVIDATLADSPNLTDAEPVVPDTVPAPDRLQEDAPAPSGDLAQPEIDVALPGECTADDDCNWRWQQAKCSGTWYCDKSGTPAKCALNAATAVVCPSDADPSDCQKPACSPATGACTSVPLPDGATCNADGENCTLDTCKSGQCVLAPPVSACACLQEVDCDKRDDGNPCNGTLYCDLASHTYLIHPNTVVDCPQAPPSACLKIACNPKTAACEPVPLPDGVTCEDGAACTAGDHCKNGWCSGKTNLCACQQSADCDKIDDGNPCTGVFFCDVKAGQCVLNPASVVVCPAAGTGPCGLSVCDPKTGQCMPAKKPDGAECDADGTFCTSGDGCMGGTCQAGELVCACKTDADCALFEDGDASNGTLYCDKALGKCKVNPASLVVCPLPGDASPCWQNLADKKTGKCTLQPKPDGTACEDDGIPCTLDGCKQGQCALAKNACLCLSNGDCAMIGDGDQCNGTEYCDKTGKPWVCVPKPNSEATCPPPASACGTAACEAKTGQCITAAKPDGTPCDAKSACIQNPKCVFGACVGVAKTCDDGNMCTDDACNPATGCTFTPNSKACGSVDPCVGQKLCQQGSCVTAAPPFWSTTLGGSGVDLGRAITATATEIVLVGTVPGAKAKTDIVVAAFDHDGKKLWQKQHDNKLWPTDASEAYAIAPFAGGWAVAGSIEPGPLWPWLWHLAPDGALIDVWYVPEGKTKAQLRALATRPDGRLVAVGHEVDPSQPTKALYALLEPDAADPKKVVTVATSELIVSGANNGTQALGVAASVSDAVVVGQMTMATLVKRAFAMRIDPSGKLVWGPLLYATPTFDSAFRAVASAGPGAGWAAAGFSTDLLNGKQFYLVRFDVAGKVLWQKNYNHNGIYKTSEAFALVSDGSGYVLAGFGSLPATGDDVLGVRTDAWGNYVYSRTLPLPGKQGLAGITVLPDGAAAMVGETDMLSPGKSDILVGRTTPYGMMSCDWVKACPDTKAKTCDDGNVCTWDSCDAAGTCIHGPNPAGSVCGPGNATCQGGSCK